MSRLRIFALALAALGGGLTVAGAAPGADGTEVPSAAAPIVAGIDSGGGPYVTMWDRTGSGRGAFLPYFDFSVGGTHVAAGDVDGDGDDELVTVPGRGGRGEIRAFDASGNRIGPTALSTTSGCGSRIAVGDVNGDHKADYVAGLEQCSPNIQVFDGATGKRLAFFGAFAAGGGNHGIRVASGDVTGDGRAEVIAANGPGDPPTVRIFNGTPGEFFPVPLLTLNAFDPSVTGGLEVASADMDDDGKSDLIVGAETADDSQVKVFDAANGALRTSFHPFGLVKAGTLRVAAGDVDGDGRPEIVASATLGYSPTVRVFAADGEQLAEARAFYNGTSLAVGNLDGDGTAELAMSSGPGYSSTVVTFDEAGTEESWFQAYGYSFTNGVRVAAGDLDGNGTLEYITGQGPGGESELLVLDAEGNELRELHPFGESWPGLYVAAGDVDGDARADIVAGAGALSEPRVNVYGGSGDQKASFLAFDPEFQGGVRVATGDVDGDGSAEIVAGAGPGGPPVVRVFDAAGDRQASFFAFDQTSTDGVDVAAGDLDGDGRSEIVVGAGTGGEVRVFDANGTLRTGFTAYSPAPDYTGGVRVAVGDVDGDGVAEIVTGPTQGKPVDVSIFTADGSWKQSFRVNPEFRGGIYVAVPPAIGPRLQLSVPQPHAVEGRPLHVVASLVDPAGGSTPGGFAATVTWGDNRESQATVSALGGGRYRVEATRKYVEFGRYRVTVRVADSNLRGALAETVAKVADAPLVARGLALRTGSLTFNGVVALVQDRDRKGTAFDLSARVLWGDGKRSSGRIVDLEGGRFRVLARHRYARPGSYRVVISVRSAGGSRATARSSVRTGGASRP
jgi:hypothetical protein